MDSTLQSSIQAAGAEAAQGTASQGPLVLQVLPAMDMGGVERGTVQTAAALTAAGWRAMVASSGGPMVHELSRAGAKHIEMPLAAKRPFRMLRNADALADLINREGVDLVHARSRAPAWSALSAARRTDKPFVTTFHNAYGHNWLKHHYIKVMAKGDKVIAISDFVAQHVRETYGVDDDRLVTIHRGINADIFDPANVSAERMIQLSKPWRLPDDRPVIMLPGRLTRWKGHSVLIEALAILGRKDICCVLVGGDQGRTAYRQKLEEQARRRGLDQVLRVVEHCSDMAAAYMLADVVVSASTHPEGFGRVAVEAQAMGRPVIATDHGGSRETIWHDESGWLVPPNEPEAMAAALERALSLNQAEREAMAANGRDNVEQNFTVTLMCQRILAVYQSLLG